MCVSVLALLAATFVVGCDDDLPKPDGYYAVRAQVGERVEGNDDYVEWVLHHEAITDYKNREGKVVGMAPMPMKFAFEKGLGAESLRKGDKVKVLFELRYNAFPQLLVTRVTPLPKETALSLTVERADGHGADDGLKQEGDGREAPSATQAGGDDGETHAH